MKKLQLLVIFALCLFAFSAQAQTDLWKQLAKVTFEKKYNSEIEENVMLPVFDERILALEGTEVEVVGYLVPLEMSDDYFALSAFPFAACFFCGAAGPETVMEIYLEKGEEIAYTTEPIRIKGILQLNKTDINHLIFILKKAEYLGKS